MAENNKIQDFKSSGNIIVDQVGQMGITGNIVNPNWNYYVTNESGKTNYLAVQILAEIVYWYRPSIKENKTTGISEFEKRFKHDITTVGECIPSGEGCVFGGYAIGLKYLRGTKVLLFFGMCKSRTIFLSIFGHAVSPMKRGNPSGKGKNRRDTMRAKRAEKSLRCDHSGRRPK